MARLHPRPYPGNWSPAYNHGDPDPMAEIRKAEVAIEALHQAELAAGRAMLRFQIADGYALYMIVSREPLVLQHVPYGDAYMISPATMRGLLLADVDAMIQQEQSRAKWLRKLDGFAQKEKA